VSKDTPDAARRGPDGRTRGNPVANDPAGFAALRGWAERHAAGGGVHYCLEATGPYSEALAPLLHAAGLLVSVANPARGKAPARACGQANQTDPADARASASLCRDRRPRAGVPPSPAVRQLQALVRRRDDRRRRAAAEKTRREAPDLTPATRKSVTRMIRPLGREAGRVQAGAEARVRSDPVLAADGELLETVTGIGRPTATTVLAELPPVEHLPSAQSAAAYCGLAPREFTSGKTVRQHTRLSKAGNARLRAALHLPTRTAIRFNPVLQGSFERLVAAGKPKMPAIGACLRKLVMLCYGVLKNRTPFDPAWSSKKTG
jgi:transposase